MLEYTKKNAVTRTALDPVGGIVGGGVQPRVNLSYPNACELLRAAAKTYQNPLFCKHLSRNFAGCFVAGRVAADAGSIARLGIEPGS